MHNTAWRHNVVCWLVPVYDRHGMGMWSGGFIPERLQVMMLRMMMIPKCFKEQPLYFCRVFYVRVLADV